MAADYSSPVKEREREKEKERERERERERKREKEREREREIEGVFGCEYAGSEELNSFLVDQPTKFLRIV